MATDRSEVLYPVSLYFHFLKKKFQKQPGSLWDVTSLPKDVKTNPLEHFFMAGMQIRY